MRSAQEEENRRLLRVRDAMDRDYRLPLDVPALAALAHSSEAHFSRRFKAVFGETPGRYLQRRRIERAMSLLRRTDLTVEQVCRDVGFTSLATFSRRFKEVVGQSPSDFRGSGPAAAAQVPTCFEKAWTRPR